MALREGRILNLYKRLGETPRERLERLRVERPEFEHEVLSYAGRLDPMAEGVLLALVGPENKRRDEYLDLSKEYTVDVLFGFSTDTYDVLGKILREGSCADVSAAAVKNFMREFRGVMDQEYPPFSSKTVEGKSLFSWARTPAIDALVLPKKTVTVYDIALERMYKVKEPMLRAYIEDGIGKVNGDFRQEEILRLWAGKLSRSGAREFACARITVSCSSGTYVRSISNRLGELLQCPALALHILRTKVGEYSVASSWR